MKKFGCIGVAIIAALVMMFLLNSKTHSTTKSFLFKPTEKPREDFTFLIMGYGGGHHDGAYLTDTLMVANVNIKTKKVVLVSLPRDIWVKLPLKTNFSTKLNAVYQTALFPDDYPAIASEIKANPDKAWLIKSAIKDITGLTPDGYITIDFQGFIKAVDTLGGVDVQVERTFTDDEYPIDGKEADLCGKEEKDLPDLEKIATQSPTLAFPCRYETLHFTEGSMHMNGATALKYARSRHSAEDGGDFNRSRRQFQVLKALQTKVLSLGSVTKITLLYSLAQQYMKLEIPSDIVSKLSLEAPFIKQYQIEQLVISNANYLKSDFNDQGQYILSPRSADESWSEVHQAVRELVYPTPTPLPTTKPSPTH